MITARPHALVSSDVTRNTFTINSGLICFMAIMQLQIWKRLIAWEKSNPTRTEDQAVLVKRGEPSSLSESLPPCPSLPFLLLPLSPLSFTFSLPPLSHPHFWHIRVPSLMHTFLLQSCMPMSSVFSVLVTVLTSGTRLPFTYREPVKQL